MRVGTFLLAGAIALCGASEIAQAADHRVVSFDHGSLDTLDALGLGDQVVGLPKQGLPAYLQEYQANRYTDVGSLKIPDTAAIKALEPTLILVTGRQGEAVEELKDIADVHEANVGEGTYWTAFETKVLDLAEHFDRSQEAERALSDLNDYIAKGRASIDTTGRMLVVTHNDGNFGLRTEPVVYDLLGFSVPKLPESVKTVTRGTRTFTPLTPADIAEIGPDQLLIVDRSNAIGQGDKALNVEALRTSLDAVGGEAISIKYLSPRLWYLSGGGLESVRLQVDEVLKAL
ncbi:ABC transporter substrate-binding protein [Marinobacter salinexigens]|uniref:ABC transporter substrate-binding protein n=1 Tax=Marinobacter salinexigens TaxID=2919747 RepID=A0A5B0V8R9_9GAMM|nr:ABC transporter substrate-binding protein [Marinobacter salinexigens]KAA1171000.1 ABC transporter substrate-binding protein [Marinobacter salinexigens]